MHTSNLSKSITEQKVYETPTCNVIIVGTHRVICASETEKVTEEEGEW